MCIQNESVPANCRTKRIAWIRYILIAAGLLSALLFLQKFDRTQCSWFKVTNISIQNLSRNVYFQQTFATCMQRDQFYRIFHGKVDIRSGKHSLKNLVVWGRFFILIKALDGRKHNKFYCHQLKKCLSNTMVSKMLETVIIERFHSCCFHLNDVVPSAETN